MSKHRFTLALAAATLLAASGPTAAEDEKGERDRQLVCLERCRAAEDSCYETCVQSDEAADCFEDCLGGADDCIDECD